MADGLGPIDIPYLQQALLHAHHPTLAIVYVHLTGDTRFIDDERFQPEYVPVLGDPNGSISEEAKAELREAFIQALVKYRKTGELPPAPDAALLKRMMDYCATDTIPDEYLDFVSLELPLDGEDKRMPGHGMQLDPDKSAQTKMVIIGAGMSGLLAGIVFKQHGIPFEIIEKNPELGGTWYENTYPGCRVDGPNHLYSYSFEADHAWPYHFSTQDLLLDYFKQVADKYDLRPHIRFNTEVKRAVFDEATKTWTVTVQPANGAEEQLASNGVVSAVGQLNRPNMPDIPGVGTFKGPSFHSAQWDHSVDLTGKCVGVIGTGASAFQFVPAIADQVGEMRVFQRTPGWLVPTPEYHEPVTSETQHLLDEVPFYQIWFRFFLFLTMADGPLEYLVKDPNFDRHDYAPNEAAAELREQIEAYIADQVPDDPALRDAVIPKFHISGKRSLRDNGVWIDALKRENVTLDTAGIAEITETGVRMTDGSQHEFDVLIYGTGFKASDFLFPMEVVGREGKNLHETWNGDARAYLGITVPDFPNFYIMYGPNTNIVVNASIIFFSECEANYILGLIKMMQDQGIQAADIKKGVFEQFNAEVDAANSQMPWGYSGANTWYRNKHGRIAQNWPFRLIDYWNNTRTPNPEDYEVV